jgi:hypothetical protein
LFVLLITNESPTNCAGRAANERPGSRRTGDCPDERSTRRTGSATNQSTFLSVTQWL